MKKITAAAFLCLFAANAGAEEITCPGSIEVAPQTLAHDVAGWQAFIDKVNLHTNLESVNVYDGKPEELGSLVPDQNTKTFAQWNLVDNGKRQYYVSCGYSQTSLQLTRELPASAKTCRVTYAKDETTVSGASAPEKVTCQ